MDNREALTLLKEYNQTLHTEKLSELEKQFVEQVEKRVYLHNIYIPNVSLPEKLNRFLEDNHSFQNLIPSGYDKCCNYLSHIHEYSFNYQMVRMDARSTNLSHYTVKAISAVGAFYIFYGIGLDMQKLIYGEYRQSLGSVSFAPVIASELLSENQEVIGYCRDVLLSENNTAVLTRDVIEAVEQSRNRELQDLLVQIFLNAKLQEGFRQSVIETADEGQVGFFLRIIDVIEEENLLRYSSIQRGVLTWIGIGYETVEEKQARFVFSILHQYMHDEQARAQGLHDNNPLCVYLALYCRGVYDVDAAIKEAVELLDGSERHIVASALIYLRLSNHFDALKYSYFLDKYSDDEWIKALYISELTRLDLEKILALSKTVHRMFAALNELASGMKVQQSYTSKGFEWFSVMLYRGNIVTKMFQLVKKCPDISMIEQMLPFVAAHLNNDKLKSFMEEYFIKLAPEIKKSFMVKEIISQNEKLGELIVQAYLEMDLDENDIIELESRLKTKKGNARALIIQVLAAQSEESVKAGINRLSASSSPIIQECARELRQKAALNSDNDVKSEIIVKGKEEGFGLYVPFEKFSLPYESHLRFIEKGFFKKKRFCDLSFLQVMTKQEVLDYIALWNGRIVKHAADEYEVHGEFRQIGNGRTFYPLDYSRHSLDALPLADVWRAYFNEDNLSTDKIFQLRFYLSNMDILITKCFPEDFGIFEITQDDVKNIEYWIQYCKIFQYYFYEYEKQETYREKAAAVIELFNHHSLYKAYSKMERQGEKVIYALSNADIFMFMNQCLRLEDAADDVFKRLFPLVYESYIIFNVQLEQQVQGKFKIPVLILARAVLLGLIPQTTLIENILDTHTTVKEQRYYYRSLCHQLSRAYQLAYFEGKSMYRKPVFSLPEKNGKECECLRTTLDLIADTLLPMEATRINDVTKVTEYVKELRVIRGMKHFIAAMHAIENEDLKRQTYGDERVVVFSNIIRNCYPIEGESAEQLRCENFPEKRLVEVAMMAPQWVDIVANVLNWDGFKEACYYFIAHMKEYDKEQKKAEIARFTDLNPEDLNDGAFDMAWCQRIHDMLGDKRMQMVYTSAKFLCENSFHVRARKYADACLGKAGKEEFLVQAKEKRNKDALNAYCICPVTDDKDLLERYTYVQQFLKESKKYGAQRQASEKRSCEIALMNLARNSRFETVTRLSWMMESRIVHEYDYALKPQSVDDIQVWIEIDEQGQNNICISKNGKKLKSIPAKYKNNEIIADIKNIHSMWTEQYRRSRRMLEQAMEERTCFTSEEIKVIMDNPIVAPMMSKLVLYSNDSFGYYENGELRGLSATVSFDDEIRIAHPYDLYDKGVWHDYQKDIFARGVVQPFKQIFRELYLKLEDELTNSETKRYTGYQIQPKKAAGALKQRRWNVSYENGLERVYYKENVVVNLYADADWFSPSDIEAPSIDYVSFVSRLDNKPIEIKDIDDVVFSETMRDVDLAVSTAFVGGVDPLTSFSTIQLRKTIIEYTCQLMKLENVSFTEHFANIEGIHQTYSIHMGSGVIHQTGGSAIHVVPVYSEKRGKVYLPFLDEDPITAQIVSKVIMFAEDAKIKDPAILNQIVSRKG